MNASTLNYSTYRPICTFQMLMSHFYESFCFKKEIQKIKNDSFNECIKVLSQFSHFKLVDTSN